MVPPVLQTRVKIFKQHLSINRIVVRATSWYCSNDGATLVGIMLLKDQSTCMQQIQQLRGNKDNDRVNGFYFIIYELFGTLLQYVLLRK